MTRSPMFAALGLLGCLAGPVGCGYHDRYHDDLDEPVVEPFYTTIDADHTLTTTLGDGAGMFVEYTRGGIWRFWTSCDTRVTGYGCNYRLFVYPLGGIAAIDGIDLESSDRVDVHGDGTLTFTATTAFDSDAIELVTKPGALLEAELELDGYVEPSYFVWYGNGLVRQGAPRSPVVFQPDAP
ncbi:MAG: hypothetical protein FJ096_11460 [Deltaproteobacteria bacterium]|nr:hypothetical protein [Deltaproteobacteria bacterium]